jgi:thioesterase domain-containing protein
VAARSTRLGSRRHTTVDGPEKARMLSMAVEHAVVLPAPAPAPAAAAPVPHKTPARVSTARSSVSTVAPGGPSRVTGHCSNLSADVLST